MGSEACLSLYHRKSICTQFSTKKSFPMQRILCLFFQSLLPRCEFWLGSLFRSPGHKCSKRMMKNCNTNMWLSECFAHWRWFVHRNQKKKEVVLCSMGKRIVFWGCRIPKKCQFWSGMFLRIPLRFSWSLGDFWGCCWVCFGVVVQLQLLRSSAKTISTTTTCWRWRQSTWTSWVFPTSN